MTVPHRAAALGLGALLLLGAFLINPWTLARAFSPDGRIGNPVIWGPIALLDAALVLAGGWLLLRQPRVRAVHVAYLAFLTLLGAVTAEVCARIVYRGLETPAGTADERLGWATMPDVRLKRSSAVYGEVYFSTSAHGFRRWGNPRSAGPRVLVLGDSYTEALQVSDGHTYYDHLARRFPGVEIFAYGAGAYGTLQEYLVLDRWVDEIRPSLVIWQFCSNDLINNDWELESASYTNNTLARRPYWERGRVVYRVPSRVWLARHSRAAHLLWTYRYSVEVERQRAVGFRGDVRERFAADFAPLRRAERTTAEIVGRARARLGSVPVVAFAVDRPPWLGSTFERVAAEHGLIFVDSIPEAIGRARAAGARVDGAPLDEHWTALGHALAARLIGDLLERRGLLESPEGGR